MNDPEIRALISAYLDGEATAQQVRELESWLARDPANLEPFLLDSFIHYQLHDQICQQRVQADALAQVRLTPQSASGVPNAPSRSLGRR